MKKISQLLPALLLLCALMLCERRCDAQWALKHYEVEFATGHYVMTMADNQVREGDDWTYTLPAGHFPDRYDRKEWKNEPFKGVVDKQYKPSSGARLALMGSNSSFSPASIGASLTVTPIFEWTGANEPTTSFWISERPRVLRVARHTIVGGGENYNEAFGYSGEHFTSTVSGPWDMALEDWGNYQYFYYIENIYSCRTYGHWKWVTSKVEANGRTARGETRTFNGTLMATSYESGRYDHQVEGILNIEYEAKVTQFSLNYSGQDFTYNSATDENKDLNTAALQNNAVIQNTSPEQSRMFWSGQGTYSAYIDETVRESLGTFTYDWDVSGDHGQYLQSPYVGPTTIEDG